MIDESVIQGIKDAASFAPLHNPAHLIGIEEALKSFPQLKDKNVAVFDTAFHQTMPEESYLYALPYNLYKEHGIRRYGAHGTSHFYVTRKRQNAEQTGRRTEHHHLPPGKPVVPFLLSATVNALTPLWA